MPEIEGGAVFWARQTIESEIFFKKPDKWFKIWFYMIMKTQWEETRGLERGQCYMKYEWITDKTGATRNEIDHCIRWLKRATQIATRKATRGFILTICNYERFQDPGNYRSDTKSDTKSDTEATQNDHPYKNNLKEKEKEIYKEKEKETPRKKRFTPPTLKEVQAYCQERKNKINPQGFMDSNIAKGWVVGKTRTPMKDWKAVMRTWEQNKIDSITLVESDIGKTICRDCKKPPANGYLQDGVCDKCRGNG